MFSYFPFQLYLQEVVIMDMAIKSKVSANSLYGLNKNQRAG